MRVLKIPSPMLILLMLLSSATDTMSQNPYNRQSLLEFRISAGPSFFFGDLGGSFGQGKRGFFDLDLSTIRANIGFGLKTNLSPRISIRTDLNHTELVGDDAHSKDRYRYMRNLSFRTRLTEISATMECVLLDMSRHRWLGKKAGSLYAFGGLGYFYFNPQALHEGTWHELQPLGTEGQGLEGNADFYTRSSLSIPFGMGVRRGFSNGSTLGLELSLRKSFTDYIDDVSGAYGDKEAIRAERGDLAAAMSDRSLGEERNRGGSYRGNPKQNDNFSFLQVTYSVPVGKKSIAKSQKKSAFSNRKAPLRCPEF